MKAIFETDDEMSIKRIVKSTDMAICLWEIVNNGWRDFKDTDYDYHKSWDKINEILEKHNINVNELVE